MVFIAPPADSTPQPGLLALSRAAFHGGIGGKCPGNRSLGAPNINNIKNDIPFSPLLAKVSSRIGPMVRTKHFTACVRKPSHCYTKQQDSHLRAVLSGSFKVRLGAHGRFHPASGPGPRFPDGCLEFKLSTVGVLVGGFFQLSRALARLPELCGQKSFK